MIAPMPEEFQERNDIAFIVTAAKYAPVECTWGFIRAHHLSHQARCAGLCLCPCGCQGGQEPLERLI